MKDSRATETMRFFQELQGLKVYVFDYEANGFLEDVTEAHCAWVFDPFTGEKWGYRPENIEDAYRKLDEADVLVGHNIIGYDIPMMNKMWGWMPNPGQIILDTLWMSRMYNPDLDGGHSLKSWGIRLGNNKDDYQGGFEYFNEDMYTYCEQDVNLNVDVFLKLLSLLQHFSWMSIICEMQTAAIIQRQMEVGFHFNYQAAEALHAQFTERKFELEDEVHRTFKPLAELVREVQPKVKKDGEVSSVGLKKLGDDWQYLVPVPQHTREVDEVRSTVWNEFTESEEDVVRKVESVTYHSGSFSLIEWPEFNLGSRQQIATRLQKLGWKPKNFTEKGNVIVDDTSLADAAALGIPEAVLLAEYFLISKRESMVKDWLAKAREHAPGHWRIHGFVNSLGAATNRMTHNSPNVAQVPAAYSPYGKECRSLFGVKPGYVLVGCDADGLELRCLAHYMNDPKYSKAVVEGKSSEGTDIHTLNQKAAGLETRDQAKTFIYAFLYGAGDAKIGSIVGGSSKQGKALKQKFLDATPALKKLREGIAKTMETRKWVKGVDGRKIRVRSPHAALNTLLQGMGAIVMKYWLIRVTQEADAEGLDWNPVANVHDEGQFEVLASDVPRFKEICEEAFGYVTDLLHLKCPVTGTADSGETWYETH